MVPTYDVIPGKGVGIFQLGDSLWHILDLLRTHKTDYPKAEVVWDPDNAQKSALTIHLPHLTLYFPHSLHQELQLIRISSLSTSRLRLDYEAQTLVSPSLPLTRARVGKILGPTYASASSSKLSFPGIAFDLLGCSGERDDVVDAITIIPRSGDSTSLGPISSVIILPNRGITVHLSEPLELIIGETTAQDLLLDLGPPLRKFWKEDDRVARMWGHASGNEGDHDNGACFWNYFQYGLDFLISPSGLISKIILHSNIPGTPLFQRYARCPWTIPISTGTLDFTSPLSAFRSNLTAKSQAQYNDEVRLIVPTQEDKKKRSTSPARAASDNGVEEPLDAMMLDRVSEGGLDGVVGVGGSRLIGFDGLIIEEDQHSEGICSVLVYRDETIA